MNKKGGEIKDWFYGIIILMVILLFLYFFFDALVAIASGFAGSAGG